MPRRSAYEILGVPDDASQEVIRTAFRRLARSLHPDHAGDDPSAKERFLELRAAYEILSDPERRRSYDQGSGGQGEPGELELTKRRERNARRKARIRRLYE